jgi:non-ribosomal peptide synthetase component E (peptide arylation enzyme)
MSTLTAEPIERNEESALLSAEGLLRRRANQKPGITALADPPNLEALGSGRPRSFNYHEADTAVDALAAFLIELGLLPGDVVAVQLPNMALSPLTMLAAWRAGLTVAALPLLWRGYEIGKACEEIAPKALIGVSRCGNENHGEILCGIAADQLSVRFVLGFGPDLPDGVVSLDDVIEGACKGARPVEARRCEGPSLVTFTARRGVPLLPVLRNEYELLAQGAMTVLALDLDTRDVILNPYPLTGPVGLSLGLMPWLISGATLIQHHPFDYEAFVEQLFTTGATVTALPAPGLAELAKDGVLERPQGRLRRLGAVWPAPGQTEPLPLHGSGPLLFDLYPLGDLAGVVLRRESQANPAPLPLGGVRIGDEEAMFVETRLRPRTGGESELVLRGPIVPHGPPGTPLAPDQDGFVDTGLLGRAEAKDIMTVRLKADPELLRHGGVAIAASEFDELYRSFPGFLDAACFVLPDPVVGDRVFAAVVPRPGEPILLEALTRFLEDRNVASYKFPDRLVVVRQIPRDAEGRVLREEILQQV